MSLTDETLSEIDDDFEEISAANFQRIETKLANAGYVDGVIEGSESVFQTSFDLGYADGLRTGFELEKYKAFFENLNTDKTLTHHLLPEKKVYEAMQLPETTNQANFQYLKYKDENLEMMSREQRAYVELKMAKFKTELPFTSNLLNLQKGD